MFGRSGHILRVDLSERKYSREPVESYTHNFIGGRGINVKVVFDEVDSKISPFDQKNRLVIGPGILAGTPAPTASRSQITTILPNGLLASSGIGGFLGAEIRHSGYDNIIIQGKEERPGYIFINDTGVEFKDASHLWGKDTQETQQLLKKELNDPDVQIMCIGPAGESLVSFSCIMTGMTNAAGHGGYGAIMGSKNLKAIVFRGRQGINIAKLEEFLDACLETRNMFQKSPAFQAMISTGGRTSAVDELQHGMTAFGNFEESNIDDKKMIEALDKNGKAFWSKYRSGRTGCIGCPVHHFHVFDFPGLGVGAPKCAAWGVFAAPLWNTDYELMYQAGFLCNQYGLDFVSTGNIIGFLMELYHKGIISERDTDNIPMRRGNKEAILSTIHKIARQEGFGNLFRNGLLNAARNIGKGAEDCAMHIKGREMPISGEPRSFKGMALSFAVCRDPLDAIPIPEFIWPESKEYAQKLALDLCQEKKAADPGSYEKKAPLVAIMENRIIATEMVGFCKWFILNLTPFLEIPTRLLSLATGEDINEKALLTAAERVRTLERAVNVIQGISRKDDRLPERLLQTPVPRGPFKGASLDKEKFDMMIDDYYVVSGWDQNGIPREETFNDLGLITEWQVFKTRMGRETRHG